jgi:predicted PurR-regulated permease PerM
MQYPSIFKPVLILASAAVLLAAMHFAASFLVPALLGLFFATLLTPIDRWLKRRRVPSSLALLLSIGFLLLVALFLALLVGRSMTTLSSSLSSYSDQFAQRQAELAAQSEDINQTIDVTPLISALDPSALVNALGFVVSTVAGIFKDGLLILMVTIFFLVEGPLFIRRMRQAFGADHYLPQNMTALAQGMISYFGLRALVNLVVAVATGVMLWFFNIEYAGLWAVLIFFLSFIPYIGAFLSMLPPLLLAYAQGGLGLVIIIGLLAVVINSLSENLVAPMVMGKGLSISPTVVFLSCIFWMFILGGPGAFLAMPLTMALIMIMRYFAETRGIVAMLVTTPEPTPDPAPKPTQAPSS